MTKFLNFFKARNNPMFWITGVSQLLLAIQVILAIFGKQDLLDQALQHKILAAVEGVITFLGTVGVFKNPITPIVLPDIAPEPAEPAEAPVQEAPSEPPEPVVTPAEPVKEEPAPEPAPEPVSEPAPEPAPEPVVAETGVTQNVETPPAPPVPTVVQGPVVVVDANVTAGPVDQENK